MTEPKQTRSLTGIRYTAFILGALGVSLAVAGIVSPYASSSPDGLERVAEDKGFLEKGEGTPLWTGAPVPDYALPVWIDSPLGTAAAGLLGTAFTFGAAWGLGRLVVRRRPVEAGEDRS